MSDGEHYVIIVLVVSLVLRGEAIAHVRILYVVATMTHANIHSSSITYICRLWTCQSSYVLIVRLGATPIYAPFRPQCNFMVSIIQHPPVLELFFKGAYIRNYMVNT